MLVFDADKYLARGEEKVDIRSNDFSETDKELVELVNKTGQINNVEFQVSTGEVSSDKDILNIIIYQ